MDTSSGYFNTLSEAASPTPMSIVNYSTLLRSVY